MNVADLAYAAALIDTLGGVKARVSTAGADLPMVYAHGPARLLAPLGEWTGVRVVATRRQYARAGCAEHCAEKHRHVVSESARWSVTGVKATVVLWNVRPYLRVHADAARSALVVGMAAPFKPATPRKMAALGWELPDVWDSLSRDPQQKGTTP